MLDGPSCLMSDKARDRRAHLRQCSEILAPEVVSPGDLVDGDLKCQRQHLHTDRAPQFIQIDEEARKNLNRLYDWMVRHLQVGGVGLEIN